MAAHESKLPVTSAARAATLLKAEPGKRLRAFYAPYTTFILTTMLVYGAVIVGLLSVVQHLLSTTLEDKWVHTMVALPMVHLAVIICYACAQEIAAFEHVFKRTRYAAKWVSNRTFASLVAFGAASTFTDTAMTLMDSNQSVIPLCALVVCAGLFGSRLLRQDATMFSTSETRHMKTLIKRLGRGYMDVSTVAMVTCLMLLFGSFRTINQTYIEDHFFRFRMCLAALIFGLTTLSNVCLLTSQKKFNCWTQLGLMLIWASVSTILWLTKLRFFFLFIDQGMMLLPLPLTILIGVMCVMDVILLSVVFRSFTLKMLKRCLTVSIANQANCKTAKKVVRRASWRRAQSKSLPLAELLRSMELKMSALSRYCNPKPETSDPKPETRQENPPCQLAARSDQTERSPLFDSPPFDFSLLDFIDPAPPPELRPVATSKPARSR